MSELDLEHEAVRQLEHAGFFVQRDVRPQTVGVREVCIAIVAWSGSEAGDLVPQLIVEATKRTHRETVQNAARRLTYYLPLIGASHAYIFDGEWHLVSDDMETTVPSECPRPDIRASKACAPKTLMSDLLRKSFDAMRKSPRDIATNWQLALSKLATEPVDIPELDPRLLQLAANPHNGPHMADALVETLQHMQGRGTWEFVTMPKLSSALVRLLAPTPGQVTMDPFCGLGTTLRAVHSSTGGQGRLVGQDVNPTVAANARKLLSIAGCNAEISLGNSFVQMPGTAVDAVVTSPPMGIRLAEPIQLRLGGTTREGTVAAIDRVIDSLREGGRAVVLVQPSFLFIVGSTEEFRSHLASKVRVVSVIELPPGLLVGTAIRCAILVVERQAPSNTLVARLEDDWEHQLSEKGDFIRAYRQHLELGR